MGAIAACAAGALAGSGLVTIFATRTVGGADPDRHAAGGAIATTTSRFHSSRPASRSPGRRARSEESGCEPEELLRRHAAGDPYAQTELVRRLLPFARDLARRYLSTGEPMDDLTQVASIGLLKAIDRFDATRGTRFTTFAVPTILGELKRHFRDHCWAVRMPRGLKERGAAVAQAEVALSTSLGRGPTVRETAAELGWDAEEVLEARAAAASYRTISLDSPREHDHEGRTHPSDWLSATDPAFELVERRAWLAALWRDLPAVERRAIHLRFFQGLTQREIADRIGCSQIHVSRLLRRAIERLRVAAAASRDAA